jgi:superoxide reductase
MSIVDFYRCEKCGNIVALIKKGGGTLTCCDQAMTKLVANSTDAAKEKHVPVVSKENGKIHVVVGSTPHPMLPEHHIEWIALVADDKVELKYLKPGEEPKAEFDEVESGTVYAYCNLHGLWKTDLAFEEDFVIENEAACSAEFREGCIIPE